MRLCVLGESSLKIPESQESEFPTTATITARTPIQLSPSIKRTPTFAEHLSSNIDMKPETTPPKSEPPVTVKPTTPPNEIQRQSSMGSVIEETKADAWEKAELAKIKDRYLSFILRVTSL